MLYRVRCTKAGTGVSVVIKASTPEGCRVIEAVAKQQGYRTCVTNFSPATDLRKDPFFAPFCKN